MNTVNQENNNDKAINDNNIILTKPLTFAGKEIKELKFRDLIAKDLKGIKLAKLEEGSIEDILKITSAVTEVPLGVLETLSLKDTMSVIAKVSDFLEK